MELVTVEVTVGILSWVSMKNLLTLADLYIKRRLLTYQIAHEMLMVRGRMMESEHGA